MSADGKPIRDGDIASYFTEFFYSALEKWQLTKLWGLANGSVGWANEPIIYIETISILESENNKIESEEMEANAARASSGISGKTAGEGGAK